MSDQREPLSVDELPSTVARAQLPTFIIGGARKAGTTSLWYYLRQHPDIGMARIKEPKFFTRQRGRNHGAPDPAPPFSGNFDRGWEWYTALFAGHEDKIVRGEASTMYLDALDAPEMICALIPWARLIFCLRRPVDRIYSHYWHERRYDGSLPEFEELVAKGHPRLTWYVDQSHYGRHLERFRRNFAAERILIVLSEDLAKNRADTLHRVCDFIGVDHARLPPVEATRHNIAAATRWPDAHRFLAHHRRDWTRPLPRFAVDSARRAKSWILRLNTKPVRYPALSARLRVALAEQFAEDVLYVEQLTGRDLSSWRC